MRKQIFVTSTVFLFCTVLTAQKTNSENEKISGQTSFFAEGGGPGIAFSANFDRRFNQTHLGWGGRAGLGFVSGYEDYYDPVSGNYTYNGEKSAITVPVQVNYIFGKSSSPHSFEVGGGITYVSTKLDIMNFYDEKRSNLFGTFSFMYRRQPLNGGFSWRAGFTPLVAKSYIQPFGAVSIGYNF